MLPFESVSEETSCEGLGANAMHIGKS